MILLILTIGVLNLCLGFALAMHLGFGPPDLTAAWDALAGGKGTAEESIEGIFREPVSTPIEPAQNDNLDQQLDSQPQAETHGDEAAEPVGPGAPENWELDEKYVETSLLKLNIAMMKSGKRATDTDTKLRACRGNTDRDVIQQCLADLKEDCEAYLAEQSEMAEQFSNRVGELGELSELGEEIEMANLEQSAQIETTLSNLSHMDFESDLEAANSRLLEEIAHLRVARHKLRDKQNVAFLAIARQEGRLEKIESRLCDDPLTKLINRIGLETTLWRWWSEGRPQSRQLTAVLFDLDRFHEVNEKHGPLMGDRILHQFARFVQGQVGEADLVGRYAGQQFLVVVPDLGPRTVTKNAERIRQSIEQITFIHGEQEIRVTAAVGLAEVSPEDTHEALFQRLEEALKQAKRAGGNQSFFHDEKEAIPIEPLNLRVEGRAIQI